jgi:hypothetical protein
MFLTVMASSVSIMMNNTITVFEKIIMNSKLTINDWRKSGKFSGMSSFAGFSKIIKEIKNEE